MMNKLKPCPACGGAASKLVGVIHCPTLGCKLIGPDKDPDGSKWNALPRREDAPKDDDFRKHWRYEFAGKILSGKLASGITARAAEYDLDIYVMMADALLAELEKIKMPEKGVDKKI